MVTEGDFGRAALRNGFSPPAAFDRQEGVAADARVFLNDLPLILGQAARFSQHGVGRANLPDIVKGRCFL